MFKTKEKSVSHLVCLDRTELAMQRERLVASKRKRRNSVLLGGEIGFEATDAWSDSWSGGEETTGDQRKDTAVAILFPMKLFTMLQDAEIKGFADIVSWSKNTDSFRVHDKLRFEGSILSKYFKMTKYKSFTRQLHNYGFAWDYRGLDNGGYSHPDFTKKSNPGNSKLLCKRRKKGRRRNPEKTTKLATGQETGSEDSKNDVRIPEDSAQTDQRPIGSYGPVLRRDPLPVLQRVHVPTASASLMPRTIEEMTEEPRMLSLDNPLCDEIRAMFNTTNALLHG